MQILRNLPNSSNSDAMRLEGEARERVRQDPESAISSLYRATTADPKFTRAWVSLGGLLLNHKQVEAGIEAFHKAMAIDPAQPAIPKALGWTLMAAGQFIRAAEVWQDYAKAHPDDIDGPTNLGTCYRNLKKYSDAAAALETAVKINGDLPRLQAELGRTYLEAGDREKAAAAFSRVAEIDSEGRYLNDIAYEMANADLKLPFALDYAKKAVRRAEEETQKITLADLKQQDLRNIFQLAAYWDTLGWVNERMSNLTTAEQYLRAAWNLTQDGVVAGHLCHMYRRTHQTAAAIRMCRLAVYRIPISGQVSLGEYSTELAAAQENLYQLTRSKSAEVSSEVIRERTFKLPRFLPGTESAEFFVLLASDATTKSFKVEDVKFISGSDKMKNQRKQLKSINFNVPAPDNVPTRFVRRGILGCYQYTGCSFVLLDPQTVNSLN
jgi:tetratricopeptide (TPR) repeat protein